MIHRTVECDVMVCGGGPSGVSASIAAARAGATVVLCQNRSVLGGNASSEIRMHIVGADANGFRCGRELETEARESGILEELRLRQACENPTRSPHGIDMVLYDMVRSETLITLLLDSHVAEVDCREGRIETAIARRPAHEETIQIKAKHFIDASGDSAMAVQAGNPYRSGRESKSEFQENHALDQSDDWRLGSTVLFQACKLNQSVPFQAPAWARKFSEADLKNRPHSLGQSAGGEECGYEYGFWWIEWGGDLDTIRDNDRIRHELLSIAYGIWDHLKNGGDHGAENYALTWVGMLPGKRESRRLIGRATLTEHDVMSARAWPDAIAYGGWPMDLHPPRGVDTPDEPPCIQVEVPHLYPIPLSCCASLNLDNLWFAGRNISATHVAFASTRVMGTCFAVGQGVGIAAAVAALRELKIEEVFETGSTLGRIQQEILRQDGFLIGVARDDPGDLARRATVTAATHAPHCEPINVINGYARSTHGKHGSRPGTMPPGTHRWISTELPASLRLEWNEPVTIACVELVFDTGLHRWLSLTQSDGVHARNVWGPQPETIRRYRIVAEGNEGEQILADVDRNYLRLRKHTFEPIKTTWLRIEVLETNGTEQARLVEVRCYPGAGGNLTANP